ncbi:PREDICTED: transcription factor bHLH52-like [Ipomoea nil]|uniref:transcription factor bHLH52-like n=1 Tax=Ipomoea nil TaxID=35883 RepID=UPI0009008A13|nr:PREDICTED: transcription factor bHLH52-like [Ipomoea nil]
MASLSYCSNWGTVHDQHLNFCETLDGSAVMASPPFFAQPQMVDDDQLEAPAAELLFGLNNHAFVLPESAVSPFDPVFNSGEFIFSDNYVSPPPPPPPEYSIPQEVEFQTHPKRQKLYHDHFPEITQNCFGVFIPNPPLLQDLNPPPPPPPPPPSSESVLPMFPELPAAPIPAYCGCAESEVAVKKNDNGNCSAKTLSAQSIAARERRRRITEKTQELGKLIPGGQKMNTAEMFQAAYKYIKFMQTQLSVLQSCHHSSQETGETFMNEELESLVGSSLIQEKLYSNDKCLVPEEFVHSLPNGHELYQLYQANKS